MISKHMQLDGITQSEMLEQINLSGERQIVINKVGKIEEELKNEDISLLAREILGNKKDALVGKLDLISFYSQEGFNKEYFYEIYSDIEN